MGLFNKLKGALGIDAETNVTENTSQENIISLEKCKISLDKTIVSLTKNANQTLDNIANVVLCLDVSGSMSDNISNGDVQSLLNILMPIGLKLDDNDNIDVYTFDHRCTRYEGMTLKNYSNYIKTNRISADGGTSYSVMLERISVDYKESGKTLVIFITDGETGGDQSICEDIIRKLPSNIFIQFIGIGSSNFSFLEKLDDLDGREDDNTGFTKASNIFSMSPEQIYESALTEFVYWSEVI